MSTWYDTYSCTFLYLVQMGTNRWFAKTLTANISFWRLGWPMSGLRCLKSSYWLNLLFLVFILKIKTSDNKYSHLWLPLLWYVEPSDCISWCSRVPFQPVTHSLLPGPDETRQQNAAGCITPLLQLESADSPCVLICTVACNVCAFHFNLPCHLCPGRTLRRGRFSILHSSPVRGLLFYFLSCPSLLPYHILVVQERKVQGRDPFLVPRSYPNIAHSECVVQQSEVGPLSRVAPPCVNVYVWSELSLTLSPHDPAPLPPPPPPPPKSLISKEEEIQLQNVLLKKKKGV